MVRHLSFTTVEDQLVDGVGIAEYASHIESGELYLEDLASKKIPLRDGELLEMITAQALLRSIELRAADVRVRARGEFSRLSVGGGKFERDLKPTWLQYAAANGDFALTWAVGIWLTGVLLTIRRWWDSAS